MGNSAAVFPLRRVGVDVWPVFTVNFSNHTGYGSWRGPTMTPDQVLEVVRGIDERGVLSGVDAVLSGYMGLPEMGDTILRAVDLVKQRNPQAIYCCDPVMGDVDDGFYAAPGIPEVMRDQASARATIMTPNLFELEFLTGRTIKTLADIVDAAEQLRDMGPHTVLVTSAVGIDTDGDKTRMIAVGQDQRWQVETPVIGRKFTGSGDLTTAMFLASLLKHDDLARALSDTAAIVYSVLAKTDQLDQSELAIVAAQDDLVDPPFKFNVSAL